MALKKSRELIPPNLFGEGGNSSSTSESLVERVARIQRHVADKNHSTPNAPERQPVTRVQIPLWSDDHRPVLHDLVRSALFTCGQKEARLDFKERPIYSLEHIKITYTGEELRQRDYDVYLQILHLSRGVAVDERHEWVEFDARALIRLLKWTQNSRSLTELRSTIRRLTACALEVVTRPQANSPTPRVYGGPLLLEYAGATDGSIDEMTTWKVKLNTRIAAQLKPGGYTRIDWNMRSRFSPLEKWLHAFYSTNQNPYPMKVETLQKLCGSRMSELKHFRRAMKAALSELVAAGFLGNWEIDDTDKVKVTRQTMRVTVVETPGGLAIFDHTIPT